MASSDAVLQTFIFYRLAPIFSLVCVIWWCFKNKLLSSEKLFAILQYLLLGKLHNKMEREKKILFNHMTELKGRTSTRPRSSVYNTKLLEIGVGSGRNFEFYPEGTLFTCLDPNPHHEKYIKTLMRKSSNKSIIFHEFVEGFGEDMSIFPDNSFDIVVCTLTLCSVQSQESVIKEVHRVLKPDGTFYFLEHVASKRGTFNRWIQDKIDFTKVYTVLFDGCHLNRETDSSFNKFDLFKTISFRDFSCRLFPGLYIPCIYGTATK